MAQTAPGGKRSTPYEIRGLRASDLEKGFLETLGHLSDLEGLTVSEARKVFESMKRSSEYRTFVAVEAKGRIIGATTLLVEQKFIHRGGLVGHLEDVVVREGSEGMGVGSALVRAAIESAKRLGCYKCILDCNPERVGFYQSLGFVKHEVGMRIDLRPRGSRPA